jgi:hypothetical protein
MKKMKNVLMSLLLIFFFLAEISFAQERETSDSSFLGALLSLLTLVVLGWSLLLCFKVSQLVKEGEINFSWRLFLGGFLFLGLTEVLEFFSLTGIFSVSLNLILFFKLIALVILAGGVYIAKKVLS